MRVLIEPYCHPLRAFSEDAWLLEHDHENRPILSVRGWKYPLVSLGVDQSLADVRAIFHNLNVHFYVRRPTNGCALLHADEFFLSWVIPHSFADCDAEQVCRDFREIVRKGLAAISVEAFDRDADQLRCSPLHPNCLFHVSAMDLVDQREKPLALFYSSQSQSNILVQASICNYRRSLFAKELGWNTDDFFEAFYLAIVHQIRNFYPLDSWHFWEIPESAEPVILDYKQGVYRNLNEK